MNALAMALLAAGGLFYVAGTLGVLRFPDVYARLHALSKVDNLGLGFIVLALLLRAESLAVAAKLVLIWALALAASATSAWLVADCARRHRVPLTGGREDPVP